MASKLTAGSFLKGASLQGQELPHEFKLLGAVDGMGWDGMGWDGMGWDGIGWDGMQCSFICIRALQGGVRVMIKIRRLKEYLLIASEEGSSIL